MSVLRIGLLQMVSQQTDRQANLAKGEIYCRQAKEMGADIALFPEMWSNGYSFFDYKQDGAPVEWQAQAIGLDDPFITHFRSLAYELKMVIALTYLQKWPGKPRNSLALIDRSGEVVLNFTKFHTCSFDIEAFLTPGDDFYVCSLDTAAGKVKIGAMICFDREFPESARILMLKGAEIILVPNACTIDDPRISQFKARAFENMVGLAMTNYAAPQENGHSMAVDAVAYEENEKAARQIILEAGEEEGVYLAEFDLDRMRTYRQNEAFGNAFRRPSRYGLLVSGEVQPPFLRTDLLGNPLER